MKIERTYPLPSKPHFQHQQVIRWAKWPFLAAAYLCPILNLALGGKPWSLVVLWSLWIAWSSLVSPDMVAYNRISQLAKLLFQSCVLLILIDLCLGPRLGRVRGAPGVGGRYDRCGCLALLRLAPPKNST